MTRSHAAVPWRRSRLFACLWLLASSLSVSAVSQGHAASQTAVPQGHAASQTAAADFLKQVRARILGSQPFRVDFVQQVYIEEEMTIQESGFIVFADRDRVKWQYLDPAPKTFILENGGYRFYDPENNQLLRGSVGARGKQLIWELLFSDRPGNASSWDPRSRTIRLSLAGENGVQELEITVGADLLPARVRQTAVNEVTTVYIFKNYRSRVALAAGEFDLDLPADVEIIDDQAP
jgi:outer membrane lipoprotein-sorting protein